MRDVNIRINHYDSNIRDQRIVNLPATKCHWQAASIICNWHLANSTLPDSNIF